MQTKRNTHFRLFFKDIIFIFMPWHIHSTIAYTKLLVPWLYAAPLPTPIILSKCNECFLISIIYVILYQRSSLVSYITYIPVLTNSCFWRIPVNDFMRFLVFLKTFVNCDLFLFDQNELMHILLQKVKVVILWCLFFFWNIYQSILIAKSLYTYMFMLYLYV